MQPEQGQPPPQHTPTRRKPTARMLAREEAKRQKRKEDYEKNKEEKKVRRLTYPGQFDSSWFLFNSGEVVRLRFLHFCVSHLAKTLSSPSWNLNLAGELRPLLGQVERVLPQVARGHSAETAGGVPEEPAQDHRAAEVVLREEQGTAEAEAARELRPEPGKSLRVLCFSPLQCMINLISVTM